MKKKCLLRILILMGGSLVAADATPEEEAVAAAKNLGQQANYSWKTVIVVPEGAPFRPGPMQGKTEKDGFTQVAGTFGDNSWEIVRQGEKVALNSGDDGWQSMAEVEKGEGPARFRAAMARNLKVPAVQADDLAAGAKDLKKEGDLYSSPLTEDAAKSLLTFRRNGGEGATVTNPAGSVRFWLKDGVLAKYEFQVKGTVNFNGNEFQNDRTTTVEISGVGTTKVEVPAEAKKKLEAKGT